MARMGFLDKAREVEVWKPRVAFIRVGDREKELHIIETNDKCQEHPPARFLLRLRLDRGLWYPNLNLNLDLCWGQFQTKTFLYARFGTKIVKTCRHHLDEAQKEIWSRTLGEDLDEPGAQQNLG